MKTILKKLIKTAVLLTAFFASGTTFHSCEEILDIPPKGSLSENVLANKVGVRALLIGAYGALDGAILGNYAGSADNWVYGSVAGGDAHKGSHANDQSNIFAIATGKGTPTSSYLRNFWRMRYEGISRANAVIKILLNVTDMTEEEKTQAEAEAKFIRGHYYFEMRRMFKWVPWIDENTTDFKTPNDREIWSDIEADFTFAMNNLPETQAEIGRVNSWAAASYLAKTYIYQKKWAEAKALFDDIIANGVTSEGIKYALNANNRDNFEPSRESGNPEAVFQVQQVVNDGTGEVFNGNFGSRLNFPYNSPFLCCGFFQPAQDLVNSFRTDASGLPLLVNYKDEVVTNDIPYTSSQHFDLYTGNLDPRLDWTVGRRGIPYLDWGPMPGKNWIRSTAASGPYVAKKNVYWHAKQSDDALLTWSPGTAQNVNVIRFTDVLLMAAETEVEVGSLTVALDYVNRIRRRAADPATWVLNDHNRAFAAAIVNSEAEMLGLTGLSNLAWVVREDTQTTFSYLGGTINDINNWQEYEIPNYVIGEYESFPDKAFASKAVRFERKLELAMEGHRRFDLVRWEEAFSELNAFYSYEKTFVPGIGSGTFVVGRDEYFPIPQSQIDLSIVEGVPTLIQNPGY
jgi:starch-binding outer membrane protein, SusD/RagB family